MANKYRMRINHDLYAEEDYLKDCPEYRFVPVVLPPVKRIIAIGDIHGDLNLAIRSFKLASLIDDNHNWIANPPDTVVVQIGDQIDSCRPIPGIFDCQRERREYDEANDVRVLAFFDQMDRKAREKGGAVYSLIGNHELLNCEGIFDYVSYENYYHFKYQDSHQTYEGPSGRLQAFRPGGPLAKSLACRMKSVIIIGSTLFVHAGILPLLVNKLDYLNIDDRTKLEYLNTIIRKWLLNKLIDPIDIKNKEIFSSGIYSPFWTRVYGSLPCNIPLSNKKCDESVKKILDVYKIGHLVVGHTPQLYVHNQGINGTCYDEEGRPTLYRVDGGFSQAFKIFGDYQIIQVLEILNDREFKVLTDRTMLTDTQISKPNFGEKQVHQIAPIFLQNSLP